MIELKSFSSLAGADFDRFLTRFCQIQDLVRVPPFRRDVLPSPVWIGLMCQPTTFAKEFWLATDGLGRCIGRIGASLSLKNETEGAIGFFEIDLQHPAGRDAGVALLSVAEEWLKSRGAKAAHGPMNFNRWFQHRFRDGTAELGESGFDWEPLNSPAYLELWRNAGYRVEETSRTRAYGDLASFAKSKSGALKSALAQGFSFRSLEATRLLDIDLQALYEISQRGLISSFLFEPLSLDAFRALSFSFAGRATLGLSHIASDQKGRPVAFSICFEEKDCVVLRRRACVPEAHGHHLSSALAALAAEKGVARGLTQYLTALESGKAISSPGTRLPLWERSYSLLGKQLVEAPLDL